ncbi:glycosyltransferase [Siminovitchia sp. FSL H7-0308]|uniref:Glycosyltransferase involved in cell wall biosynthesis n=1 Tax=Siminovitchia thermophila TaxID=1245522 RepID=A0ABS2RB81_9BACI|nr:glycosyltransferase [Siminovitchia thermophila]MBM7716595.1 glycosyltransferase involved in cell wall biosynthesis [Siminovitchia thermophila]ONK21513.1 hypothetical protein BLX87_21930 [Bacillus sp. VT-16-64]
MLSIIIPTFNQRERLAVTLENLAKQERIEHTTVYVVNDGSTDGTKQWLDELDYSWLVPIHQENRGRSAARNTGINHARSTYVLFLDDDMVVTPHFICAHLAAQQQKEAIYIGEIINIPNEHVDDLFHRKQTCLTFHELDPFEQEDFLVNLGRYFQKWNNEGNDISWTCMVAANVSFPITLFKQVNGFDERFKGWGVEDHELAFRFYQEGGTFQFLKQAKAYHLDHRKKINRTQILENVLYFYKKTGLHPEVKAYVDYVTGKISMNELYRQTMKREPAVHEEPLFFKPNKHLTDKESKGHFHATHH